MQQNASLTNVELATRVSLSPSPDLARVRNLDKLGAIDCRIAVLDASLLGLGLTAFIQVRLEKQVQNSLDNLTRAIDRIGQIMECYLVTGDSDYLLRVMTSDIEDLEDLIVNKLSRIPGVASIKFNLALKKVSHKTVLPIDATRPVQIRPCQSTARHGGRAAKARYEAIGFKRKRFSRAAIYCQDNEISWVNWTRNAEAVLTVEGAERGRT